MGKSGSLKRIYRRFRVPKIRGSLRRGPHSRLGSILRSACLWKLLPLVLWGLRLRGLRTDGWGLAKSDRAHTRGSACIRRSVGPHRTTDMALKDVPYYPNRVSKGLGFEFFQFRHQIFRRAGPSGRRLGQLRDEGFGVEAFRNISFPELWIWVLLLRNRERSTWKLVVRMIVLKSIARRTVEGTLIQFGIAGIVAVCVIRHFLGYMLRNFVQQIPSSIQTELMMMMMMMMTMRMVMMMMMMTMMLILSMLMKMMTVEALVLITVSVAAAVLQGAIIP